jgi:histidinol-phosphatase
VSTLSDDLILALSLAEAADAITTRRFRALDLRVESKPDLTPVTDADRDVEQQLREVLASARPDDAIHGEEFADTGTSARRWVIDPIDGTKNFVRGVPVWATLIALMDGPAVSIGVVSAPALRRRWWAAAGAGTWTRGAGAGGSPIRCHVSGVATLADASLSYSSLTGWEDRGTLPGFLDLTRACWRTRAYGDFWSYVLLAEGTVDVATEPEVALHDLAPLALIVSEAGGRFTDLDGRPGPDGGSALATNGLLHDAALAHLKQGASGG